MKILERKTYQENYNVLLISTIQTQTENGLTVCKHKHSSNKDIFFHPLGTSYLYFATSILVAAPQV